LALAEAEILRYRRMKSNNISLSWLLMDDPKKPELNLDDLINPLNSKTVGNEVVPEIYKTVFNLSEEKYKLQKKLDEAERKLKSKDILDGLLEPSAKKSFHYMFIYSSFVALVIIMNGFGCFKNKLESDVLNVLVGSTAATVIGLVGIVMTGIFIGARK